MIPQPNNNTYLKLFWKRNRMSIVFLFLCVFLSAYFSSLILGGAGLLFVFWGTRSIRYLDGELLFCLLAFLSFGIIRLLVHDQSLLSTAYYSLTPLFMYGLGRYYLRKCEDEDILFLLIFLFTIVLALPHIVVTIQDIFKFGLINPLRELRVIKDDAAIRAVTQRTVELSLCTIGFTMFFYKPKNKFEKKIRACFIVLALVSMLCFIHFVSRTGIALILITVLLGLSFPNSNKNNRRYIILIGLALLIIFVIAHDQILEIIRVYSEREIEGSSIKDAGGRTGSWRDAFTAVFNFPLGRKADTFAHNMWLDIGKVAGIIPFTFLTLFSCSSLLKSIRIARSKKYPQMTKMLVLSASLVFLLVCFTECIHEGAPMYMFFYLFFCGMVNSVYHMYNRGIG